MKTQAQYTKRVSLSSLIVDDEEYSRRNLNQLLKKHCPQVDVKATAINVNQARKAIDQIQPDLVFLDIQMPGLSGLDLLKSYSCRSFSVILVTAHPTYGIDAVKEGALDYLLKPIRVSELKTAVDKAWNQESQETWIKKHISTESYKISVSHTEGVSIISVKDILYLEADNMYTTIRLLNGEMLLASKPIGDFEKVLADFNFFRIHKSYLINFRYLERYSKNGGGLVWMSDKAELPVSRRQFPLFQKLLKQHVTPV
jgi:two-component system LytT family response regulator